MGKTCKPMADSYCKVKPPIKITKKKKCLLNYTELEKSGDMLLMFGGH